MIKWTNYVEKWHYYFDSVSDNIIEQIFLLYVNILKKFNAQIR